MSRKCTPIQNDGQRIRRTDTVNMGTITDDYICVEREYIERYLAKL